MINLFKKTSSFKGNQGFSLVETIIFAGAFLLVGGAIVFSLVAFGSSIALMRANHRIEGAAVSIIERMTREIKNGGSINMTESVFNSSPGSIYVASINESGETDTVQYEILNGVINEWKNGNLEGPLHHSGVNVDSLVFRLIDTGRSKAIRIEISLSAQTSEGITSDKFYSTALMKGSY